ncbi:hypothetical protein [Thalassobacillus sp. CUG 92003]|uniref:hypothetical protein n=1 Tax=Thalassobacillus sp. CUG 92003 TaxID=2736641 RepID=UPI0015E77162|nr:hypothetical protein [Thalassobacillus sp. CUG 92003]
MKQDKAKGFEVGRFLGVGIPVLYVVAVPFLHYSSFPAPPLTRFLSIQYEGGVMLFSFIFGYLLINCIRKKESTHGK